MVPRALPIVVFLMASPSLAASPQAGAADAGTVSRASAAIERFVAGRMGDDALVIVDSVNVFTRAPLPADVDAVALAGSKLGGRIQFALIAPVAGRGGPHAAEIGRVAADVSVSVAHLTAARTIACGDLVSSADVVEVAGDVGPVAIQRLPRARDLRHSRAARHIAGGELIVASALTAEPAVRAGQAVRGIVRAGRAEVVAMLIAQSSGARGALVKVINPDSRKTLRARVVDDALVEVIHE